MGLAYKCDRCGKFFEKCDHEKEAELRVYKTCPHWTDTPVCLCQDCTEQVNDIFTLWFKCTPNAKNEDADDKKKRGRNK